MKLLKFLRRLLEADVHTFYQCIYLLVKCVVIHCEFDRINQTVMWVLSTPDFYWLTDCLQKSLSWSCCSVQRVGQVHESRLGSVHDRTYPLLSELCFQYSSPYLLKHGWGLKTMKVTRWKGPVVTLFIDPGEAKTYAIYRTVLVLQLSQLLVASCFCRPGKI